MKTLYLDCGMGAAGDMLTAALVELLPNPDRFIEKLNALSIPGTHFKKESAVKCGITGTHISVSVGGAEEDEEMHAHDHEYEHNHAHEPHHDHYHHSGMHETVTQRYILERKIETVQTSYGEVRRKVSSGYGTSRVKYEYDDLARIAREQNLSIEEVRRCVKEAR